MISEEQQERASLYALGLLDADEAAAFERELAGDGQLRTLAAELREGAASLAMAHAVAPPARLKERVLARVAEGARTDRFEGKIVPGPRSWSRRAPWAAAAVLAICCGALAILCWKLVDEGIGRGHRLAESERRAQTAEAELAEARDAAPGPAALRQVVFCALEPVPAVQRTGPQAAVLWDAAHRRGRLRVTKLPPAGEGKDYQLWTVQAGRKDPVSAGVVKVGADGSVESEFRPEGDGAEVVAFALSLERAGGAPRNEGPILYLGKL